MVSMQSPQKSEKAAAQSQQESQAEWEPQQESQTEWECTSLTPSSTHKLRESPYDRGSTVEMQQDAAALRAYVAKRVDQSKLKVIQHIDQLHSEFLTASASAPDQQKACLLRLGRRLGQFEHVVDS